jgi:hypothetical protein
VSLSNLLSGLAAWAARRPRLIVAVAAVLGLGTAGLALRLHTTAATSSFVSSSSGSYRATQSFYRNFGEEPIEVLVRGDLQQLVLSSDIERLAGLESCLSGIVPSAGLAEEGGPGSPCGRLARAHTVKVVFGPGTFLDEAAKVIDAQLNTQTAQAEAQARQAEAVIYEAAVRRHLPAARARSLAATAGKAMIEGFQKELLKVALQYGLTTSPSLENPNFVSSVVFDSSKPAGTPKERFAYVFPNRSSALISVRMRAGLSESQRDRTISLVREAVAMGRWHLAHGERYIVTGIPVIASDLPSAISHSIELLMIAVLLVMAATLGLIFAGRPRLLPLALALLALALTFGALSLAGASLTMASVAVLPVLVGLAVDYSIQFQSRVGEAFEQLGPGDPTAERARLLSRAAGAGGPTIVTAGAASAAAMLALLLSPVPMVRGFGLLLVAGVAVALVCALTVGAAAMALPSPGSPAVGVPAGAGALGAAWRGARELLTDNPLTRSVSYLALISSVRRPGRTLAAGLLLAALGWGLDTQTTVQTDITKLVPQNLGSLEGLDTLERSTGVAGEIDLMVTGANLTKPATIEWMSSYERRILAGAGYSSSHGCGSARLCPAFSLPDLFNGQATGTQTGGKLSEAVIRGVLGVIPPYFSQDVITPDRRAATLAFGIRVMSLQEQQSLIDQMRSALHPPAGISATLVGLPVLAAQSGTQVADPWRRIETLLVGLAAVALVLLLAFRGQMRRALTPLVPIVLATGWSALVLFLVRVPLNPMSVTLGALVIAISTEFSVLLSERHRQERLAGHETIEALRRTYRRTGAAVAASGVTATVGFGVLALSPIAMLRDFGLVTLIDLSVSLLGVLVALPAVIVIAEGAAEGGPREQPAGSRDGRLARAGAALGALLPGGSAGTRGAGSPRAGSGHEPA